MAEGSAQPISVGRRIATAATIIMIGNIASRLLGLGREQVIGALFGLTRATDAFGAASTVSTTVYDLLIGGMISAALIPAFSEYAARNDDAELWRVASFVINLGLVALSAVAALMAFFAPHLVQVLAPGFEPEAQRQTVELVRFMMPAVVFLGIAGTITGLLYSRHRYVYSAFAVAVYNASVIVAALTLSRYMGVVSLAIGVLLGALLQIVLQLPGLRGMKYHWGVQLRHPGLRKIGKLYVPVAFSLVVTGALAVLDRNLASRTGEGSIAAMRFATTLIQFPLGLVSAALSFAILPTLSHQMAQGDLLSYRRTLAAGLKTALLLMIPAAVGLAVLSHPIVSIVFQYGRFDAHATSRTTLALLLYLPQLPFVAVDQQLVFAFYARKNTILPVLVGIGSGLGYLLTALLLLHPLGMSGLVIANTVQNCLHAVVMVVLIRRAVPGFQELRFHVTLLKGLLAAAAMGALSYLAMWGASGVLGEANRMMTLAAVLLAIVAGLFGYVLLLVLLRVDEVHVAWRVARTRLPRRRPTVS